MKPIFKINRYGAQSRAANLDEFITTDILDDICNRLLGTKTYDVYWINERNQGKLLKLETDDKLFYITYTPNVVGGRNSYLQSVPTAFSRYLSEKGELEKECLFNLYFLPFEGYNDTNYHQLMYKLLKTIGVNFINADVGLKGLNIEKYNNVRDLILDRNSNSSRNNRNESTYIVDDGYCYSIYGKTFGANQKETSLLCFALMRISDKPIRLFQIYDNDSCKLSDSDLEAIRSYQDFFECVGIEVLDDTYIFPEDKHTKKTSVENLRSPRFIYNLLKKTNGHKECTLCDCHIEAIIQGAHIYPIEAIKIENESSFEDKLAKAVDGDNGLWLCENHHKLFDRGLLSFQQGKILLSSQLDPKDLNYIKHITLKDSISEERFNLNMKQYFDLREKFYKMVKNRY